MALWGGSGHCRAGREAEAQTVFKPLATTNFSNVVTAGAMPWGSVAHYLGVLNAGLGRFEEAEAAFAATADQHHRMGAPAFLAQSRVQWAEMLLHRKGAGDSSRAQILLTQAIAAGKELSLSDVEHRAQALLETIH